MAENITIMTAALYRPAHGGHPTPEKPWKVKAYIRGGSGIIVEEFTTKASAEVERLWRQTNFGGLGIRYVVTEAQP